MPNLAWGQNSVTCSSNFRCLLQLATLGILVLFTVLYSIRNQWNLGSQNENWWQMFQASRNKLQAVPRKMGFCHHLNYIISSPSFFVPRCFRVVPCWPSMAPGSPKMDPPRFLSLRRARTSRLHRRNAGDKWPGWWRQEPPERTPGLLRSRSDLRGWRDDLGTGQRLRRMTCAN